METSYQIRREPFGLCLVSAPSAREALVKFMAEKEAGKHRGDVKVLADGTAEVEYDGVTYRAV